MTECDLSPPTPITSGHVLADFDSGELSLDDWLKKRAFKNQAAGASRCFVLAAGTTVIGYYSLSAGVISHAAMRRNLSGFLPPSPQRR